MILGISGKLDLWELVAAIQVCQSQGCAELETDFDAPFTDASNLLRWAQIAQSGRADGGLLSTDSAYRKIDSVAEPYPALLARLSGLSARPIRAPRFAGAAISPTTDGGIVLCPFEVSAGFKLPWKAWKAIVRHLRTYGLPVHLLGEAGQRMDYAAFTEGSVLSDLPMFDRLKALAAAKLVVGVPNAWTWMATAWNKSILALHPDDIPQERWFGFEVAPRTLGRLLYTSSQIQIPVLLAGLRKLIDAM